MITRSQLVSLFHYSDDPLDIDGDVFYGHLIYREPSKRVAGRIATHGMAFAGTVSVRGDAKYIRVNIDGKLYYLHRLIWIYHGGTIPDGFEIDHINGTTTNSRLSNLRCVTSHDNRKNRRGHKSSTSKYVGVKRNGNLWYATVMLDRKAHSAGSYVNEIDAAIARDNLALKLFGDMARLNFPEKLRHK